MTPRQLKQARNIRQLSGKLLDAANAGDEQLFDEYAGELEHAVTEVVNEIEERHKIGDARWIIEYRDDLHQYELKERAAHRGLFNYFDDALKVAADCGAKEDDIAVLGIEDPRHLRRRNLVPPRDHDPSLMTREEDQLQRESDERAAFNDRLDYLRGER